MHDDDGMSNTNTNTSVSSSTNGRARECELECVPHPCPVLTVWRASVDTVRSARRLHSVKRRAHSPFDIYGLVDVHFSIRPCLFSWFHGGSIGMHIQFLGEMSTLHDSVKLLLWFGCCCSSHVCHGGSDKNKAALLLPFSLALRCPESRIFNGRLCMEEAKRDTSC